MTRPGSSAFYDAHPDAPTWMEAQQDAIHDARDSAHDARVSGDHDLADYWTREADRLEDQAWERRERGRA